MMVHLFLRRIWIFLGIFLLFGSFVTTTIAETTLNAPDKSITTIEDGTGKSLTLSVTGGSRTETYVFAIAKEPSFGGVILNGENVTYIPEPNFNGTDSFQYQVTGSIHGASTIGTVTVTVTPRNDAPTVTESLSFSTHEEEPVTFSVTGTDIDGDILTCSTGKVSGGSSSIDPSRCLVTFTPYPDFIGEGSVYVRAFDGTAYSPSTQILVTVLAVNEAPVATDVSKSVLEDLSTTIVLNATDADRDPLTFALSTPPQHGTVVLENGSATYTPKPNFNGQDTFSYFANDGIVDSNRATTTITISPVNDIPIPTIATYQTPKNQRIAILLEATDADEDALTFGISQTPSNGRVSATSTNTVEYLPDEDFVGIDSFEFWSSDGFAYPKGIITIQVVETASSSTNVGTIIWQRDLGNAIISGAPAFDTQNHIYFGTFEGGTDLFSFSADGNLLDQLDISLRVESSVMSLEDQLIINTLGTYAFDTALPGDGSLGGIPMIQRLGTMSIGLEEDGTFDEQRVWGDSLHENGRDGSPGRNEDGSIIYAADVYRIGVSLGSPHLVAIDSTTGETKQAIDIPGWSYASPLFLPDYSTTSKKDGLVVIGPEVDDQDSTMGGFGGLGGSGELLAFRVDEQGTMETTPVWNVAHENAFDRGASAAMVNGQTLIFTGTLDGTFYGIRPQDGTIVWKRETGGSGLGTVTVSQDNRTIYAAVGKSVFMSVDAPIYSSLIAMDAETGELLWTHTIENNSSVPIVGDRGIYILGTQEVLAVNEQGEELWSLPLEQEPYYGYSSLMPQTGLLVFGAGTSIMAVQTESTGPSTTSSWPSYRATPDNSGIPQ